jgi:WD40 repeat protein
MLFLIVPLLLLGWLWYLVGQRPRLLPGLGGGATSIAFSPNGRTLVCASSNNYVQMWKPDIEKWRSFASATNYQTNLPPFFTRLCFSPDSTTLYAAGSRSDQHYSSVAHSWDVATRRRKFAFNFMKSPAFDISPDGRWAALGYLNSVHLIDLNGKPKPPRDDGFTDPPDYRVLPFRRLATSGNVTCVAFSPDSKTLVVGDESFQWPRAFWNVQTAQRVAVNAAVPTSGVPSFLEWSPDGKRVAVSDSAKIAIYDVAANTVLETPWPRPNAAAPAPMMLGFGTIAVLAWSPDGQWLFSGGDEVRQWRAKDLQVTRSFGVAGPVAVSPDGSTLATANQPRNGDPHGILLWKIN